jgi:uncharacterized protein DUF4375
VRADVDHGAIMNAVDKKRQEHGFDALNEAERVVTLISYAGFEIENGGIEQFYGNSAGDYANETVWALGVIGASRAADIVTRANSLFDSKAPPRNWNDRGKSLSVMLSDNDIVKSFRDLTVEFYHNTEDIYDLIYIYIEEHLADLTG